MRSFKDYCEEAEGGSLLHMVKNNEDFWVQLADFANLNPNDLSNLLDVPMEIVTGWYGKIHHLLKTAEKNRSEEEKTEMLPTGKADLPTN